MATQAIPAPVSPVPFSPATNPGALDDREVDQLRIACARKYIDKGAAMGTILYVAMVVAAIWVGLAVGGTIGGFLALGIYFIIGNAVVDIYHGLRNRDYLDARDALKTLGFKQYLQNHHFDLSIDSIVTIHNQYKKHVADQTANV